MDLDQTYQLLRVFHRQRPQKQGVDKAKDQRVCANADPQKQGYRYCENWAPDKKPPSKSNVAPELIHTHILKGRDRAANSRVRQRTFNNCLYLLDDCQGLGHDAATHLERRVRRGVKAAVRSLYTIDFAG